MKKIGIVIFIIAISIGVIAGNFFSFGRVAYRVFNINFVRGVQGSGVLATEKRDISGFNGVDVGGVFQVEMVAQKDYSVEVTADDNIVPMVKTCVSNGILKIQSDGRFSNSNPIRVRISAPNIESIRAAGASKVTVSELKNSSVDVDTSGASRVSLSGETSNLTIEVSGASHIDAAALRAENADVDASGASNISVFATNRLSADASGASRISYTGSPASVEKKASGASKISQK
jgi:hypothetical protein